MNVAVFGFELPCKNDWTLVRMDPHLPKDGDHGEQTAEKKLEHVLVCIYTRSSLNVNSLSVIFN